MHSCQGRCLAEGETGAVVRLVVHHGQLLGLEGVEGVGRLTSGRETLAADWRELEVVDEARRLRVHLSRAESVVGQGM